MDSVNTVCPVCTLYLRPGITLKQHLTSHPKQKVIEALVKLAGADDPSKAQNAGCVSNFPAPITCSSSTSSDQTSSAIANQSWSNSPAPVQMGGPSNMNSLHGNHLFIYQQSMSTSSPQGNAMQVNPLSQQYVYHPAIFNPQMMPYVYQQQQVILASNSVHPQMRALPFDISDTEPTITPVDDGKETEKETATVAEKDNNVNIVILQEGDIEELADDTDDPKKEIDNLHTEEDIKTMEDFENEQTEANDIPPEEFQDNEDENREDFDQTEVSRSSYSESTEWKNDNELSKACQTQTAAVHSPKETLPANEGNYVNLHQIDYFYVEQENENFHREEHNTSVGYTVHKESENYEQSEPIYTSANILQGNDHLDFMNLDDIVITGEYTSNPVASHVEHFDATLNERPKVLMTIGEMPEQKIDFHEPRDFEESVSRSSSHVNIRSDERMPPRGELSGQESLGGNSDISTWNRLHYQEGGSYEIIERESWEASDSESFDMNSVKKQNTSRAPSRQNTYEDDMPTIVSYFGPPLNFKCSTCGEDFASSKERKEHELNKHPGQLKSRVVGSEIGKKTVKKLIIKAKSEKPAAEPSFDNIFTNKLKLESTNDVANELASLETQVKKDEPALEISSIKAVCPICDCIFDNSEELRQHRIELHKGVLPVKHKCLTCGEIFPNEYKYTDHLKVHPLECRLCGKLFFRRQNIRLHMKRHLGLRPYKCDICEKSFVTKQKHDEHKNIHTGEAPIKCNLCDEKFRRHSNLVQHRNRHHFQMKKKIKEYICHCGEIFHSKKKLAWHKEIHDAKPKACSHCSEKFLHVSSLTRHMRRAHNDKFLPEESRKNENVECPICKGTYLKSSLDVHIKNHSGTRPYTCLMCNKHFTTKWNLKLHKWTHASRTSKPFKCDLCKGAFIRESDYTAHMNSHKSVRPYTCNYCGAQFIRKYNCLRHVKEHESDKTFSCNVCGKTFHRSYYLKDHMRVHSGVRPYSCHICGKTSTTKSNHNKHVQIHHAREPVSTEN
ncbi:unnamed protein product [Phyllotreta striolata]|uniref:C2H2-type domain-containing protein n=1 Tax=Phyllotreta striolata TaxID=444603 RepID=A0A9N9XS87_PHYSR|nr:unnamed protein product [Phyllotreta striolata]